MANVNQQRRNSKTSNNTRYTSLAEVLNRDHPNNEFPFLNDPDLNENDNDKILQRIQGSLVGLAVGDALGASVEFRPYEYMQQHPVEDMQGGGTWGLKAGQWTDDTSMALCLAASLIVKEKFHAYDQLERYARWFNDGYMSSTDQCFDIGKSTREAILEFEDRKRKAQSNTQGATSRVKIDVKCGAPDAAGNGPLMRLAPIPLFFHRSLSHVLAHINEATEITHGNKKAVDACRFYASMIWRALDHTPKEDLLNSEWYFKYLERDLHEDVKRIVQGSCKNKDGYKGGIRGKGYVLDALEAALWAFYNDEGSFEKGVLLAINLGDDTDTTAAIYGELAGAVYGIEGIPQRWLDGLFEKTFIMAVAHGLFIKGKQWGPPDQRSELRNPSDQVRKPTKVNLESSHDKPNDKSKGPAHGQSHDPGTKSHHHK